MDIGELAERAGATYLRNANLSTVPASQIYTGIGGDDSSGLSTEENKILLPRIIVESGPAEPVAAPSNTWKVPLTFRIQSQADDETAAQHSARVQEVMSKLRILDLASRLSDAIDGFTAELAWPSPYQSKPVDRKFESSFTVDVTCIPADIS